MGYEVKAKRRRRSAIGRARLFCLLLALPTLVFTGIFFYQRQIALAPALLLAACLLIYLTLLASALVEGLVRPLQTLSNVVASLREGDYSFRARGADAGDALGELATEVNALADLLQKQRVRSLEATALLARILEVMHAPLFAFDRENLLQLVNDAGLKLLNLPHARCFGHPARELGLDELLNAPDQTIHSFAAKPTRWLLRKAVFREEGAPHTLLLLADVSLPLQEEEQAAWKRLIRVLGHELSNSLAPIKSIAGSLLARVDSLKGEEATLSDFSRGLGVVESRADVLHRFVQSYRVLAQLPPPQLQPVPLTPLLERVALLEQRLPVKLEPGPLVVLNADPDQLEQMFINLLANAVDASLERLQSSRADSSVAKSGISFEKIPLDNAGLECIDSETTAANGAQPVRASWKIAGSSLLVSIEDCGLGIANTENLFVPFYTTKQAGSGVGLALAQQIARAHGGEIQLVNREDGEGARATIRLPLAMESTPQ
jgi:nitrogen fixation/metabolism regulation signal transduction histidine kinase